MVDFYHKLEKWDYIDRYSQWMYRIYSDYVGKRIFDVGAGMGRMVSFYIDKADAILATDINKDQIDSMRRRFADYPNFKAELIDILESDLSEYENQFDTVICINVLEHLSDDYQAVENMKSLLKVNGYLIVFVPAFQKLYSDLDRNVGHFRRYDKGRLYDIAKCKNLRIVKHHYFNMLGIIPYWIKGRKRLSSGESFSTSLNKVNSKLYNLAAIVLEPIEKAFPPKIGLTEVIVLRKV